MTWRGGVQAGAVVLPVLGHVAPSGIQFRVPRFSMIVHQGLRVGWSLNPPPPNPQLTSTLSLKQETQRKHRGKGGGYS